jgi:hypothetical protein
LGANGNSSRPGGRPRNESGQAGKVCLFYFGLLSNSLPRFCPPLLSPVSLSDKKHTWPKAQRRLWGLPCPYPRRLSIAPPLLIAGMFPSLGFLARPTGSSLRSWPPSRDASRRTPAGTAPQPPLPPRREKGAAEAGYKRSILIFNYAILKEK